MKKIVLAVGVSVLALAAPAAAEDGFYIGLGGIHQANDHETGHKLRLSSAGWFNTPLNRDAVNALAARDVSTDGYGASIFGGYQMALGANLTGALEVDAQVFDGDTSITASGNYPFGGGQQFTLTHAISQQILMSIRAKLGVDVTPNLNVFVTGGYAMSDVEVRTSFSDLYTNAGPPVNSQRILLQTTTNSDMPGGFVYGGGIDYRLGGSTKLRIDYLRQDLGEMKVAHALNFQGPPVVSANGEIIDTTAKLSSTTFRIGLSWDLDL